MVELTFLLRPSKHALDLQDMLFSLRWLDDDEPENTLASASEHELLRSEREQVVVVHLSFPSEQIDTEGGGLDGRDRQRFLLARAHE